MRSLFLDVRLRTILSDISAQSYRSTESNLPHVILDIGTGPIFIPQHLLVDSELRELLVPIDEMLRRKFGRRYRVPLLPMAEEGRDLKRLWEVSGAR